jgi:hypothetical protein
MSDGRLLRQANQAKCEQHATQDNETEAFARLLQMM